MSVFVIVLAILALVVYGVISYRDLAQMQRDIAAARQEISDNINRRHQLFPELLQWLQEHAGMNEKELQEIEQAARRVQRVHHKSSLKELGEAETALRHLLGELFPRLVRQPVLYNEKGFARLHRRITGLQIIIAERSESYNRLVNENNRRLQRHPDAWLKDYCRFEVMECLQFQEEESYSIEYRGMYA